MKTTIIAALSMLLLGATCAALMLATCRACKKYTHPQRAATYHRTPAERAEAMGWGAWHAKYADTREMLLERRGR